jgi:hypothetical protein
MVLDSLGILENHLIQYHHLGFFETKGRLTSSWTFDTVQPRLCRRRIRGLSERVILQQSLL